MKILVTGDKGYIGTILVQFLIKKGYSVYGYDIGYYEDCLLYNIPNNYHSIFKDIRDIEKSDIDRFDVVIHLAGLSNDPVGEFNKKLTEEINLEATLRLANISKMNGVKRFIYASSQSMYGISNDDGELDEYNSNKNPITTYAKTKWDAECYLNKLNSPNFNVISFRPSTVFGWSPRLRCDIVYNNFIACAFTEGKIEIKSDGTPWRPAVSIDDVCAAFLCGIVAPENLVSGKAFNVGVPNGNYSVRELAEAAGKILPLSKILFTGEHGNDARTYKVSFNKILSELKDYYKFSGDLIIEGNKMVEKFKEINFTSKHFRGSLCNRLPKLHELISNGIIDSDLRRIKI
jgi:nucleoside-diphosphate-sugar epimerase